MHRIYTRRGDRGATTTRHREALSKDDPRVLAYGSLYELNAHLGLALAELRTLHPGAGAVRWPMLLRSLEEIQHRLFYVGRDLSQTRGADGREPAETTAAHVARLERLIDELAQDTPPWKPFTLPGGSVAAAHLFVATTVCRRAESRVVALHRQSPVPDAVLAWVNRLSDLLFVAARYVNGVLGTIDPPLRPPDDGF
jgi:cob(I)alamin adenosyltransferase